MSYELCTHIILFRQKNIFQCILASDFRRSFVIFNYADGSSQLNDDELSTAPEQAGINAAFKSTANFVSIPSTKISTTSNVDIPGVWMFQTNGRHFTRACKSKKTAE